jgi:endonuclease-3
MGTCVSCMMMTAFVVYHDCVYEQTRNIMGIGRAARREGQGILDTNLTRIGAVTETIIEGKQPFDIETALRILPAALEPFPKAALFALYAEGHTSAFEILAACILSIRTLDEDTLTVSRRLLAQAHTPAQMTALSVEEIDVLITSCTFHDNKARQLHVIAARLVNEYGGELPCDRDLLLSFAGVGPKCANLVMGIACGEPFIGVDIHVHRVTNRWGYVQTKTPEDTLAALEARLPRPYWIELNRLLMPFGKFVCTGKLPRCSTCPVLEMCQQVRVTSHR